MPWQALTLSLLPPIPSRLTRVNRGMHETGTVGQPVTCTRVIWHEPRPRLYLMTELDKNQAVGGPLIPLILHMGSVSCSEAK